MDEIIQDIQINKGLKKKIRFFENLKKMNGDLLQLKKDSKKVETNRNKSINMK
jgi:hypothetical protein